MTTAEPPVSGSPGEEPAITDEEWAEFLRDVDGPAARTSAPKEPSARARMVAERLRRLDEEEARRRGGGRNGTKARRRGLLRRRREESPVRHQPDPWRAPPTGGGGVSRGPRSSRASTVITVLVGFLLGVLVLSWLLGPARY